MNPDDAMENDAIEEAVVDVLRKFAEEIGVSSRNSSTSLKH
jgi:hypothetical protein